MFINFTAFARPPGVSLAPPPPLQKMPVEQSHASLRHPPSGAKETAHQALRQESAALYTDWAADIDRAIDQHRAMHDKFGPLPSLVSYWRIIWTMALTGRVLHLGVPGDIVETGVFTGGSTISMLHVVKMETASDHDLRPPRLWACDSFQGTPAPVGQDKSCNSIMEDSGVIKRSCKEGAAHKYSVGRSVFESNLRTFDVPAHHSHVHVVEGWYNETLPPKGLKQVSFLRLDGDMYTSTRDALVALYPLVVPGAIIYVDDYGSFGGCALAVDEFLKNQSGTPPVLHRILEPSHHHWWLHWFVTSSKPFFFEAVWWVKP